SSWNTSNVTDMNRMFDHAGCSATTWSVGNLSSWDTSSVTDMYQMFYAAGYDASSFILNLSFWDTSSVTSLGNMFDGSGYSATTWSVTIPKTNNGTASGPIANTNSNLYGKTTSVTATPPWVGKPFTLAN
ncbi:BspA family leucine-rich repeat surface protein, partial [Candidatus Saccharibacteria bacterium]|nr:BspA family leucine-rich repeat surface protein [Candidatus Saccharibacteria bacterium]